MAKIGPVQLKIDIKGAKAHVEVTYDIVFSRTDQKNAQAYEEECRLIGDDTNPNDPPTAGGSDTIGFMTPLFTKDVAAAKTPTLSRHVKKSFRTADLDEDRGSIPNPDEIRARVRLLPVPPSTAKVVTRQSPIVRLQLG
jgi:hypothetical protein